MVSNNSFVHLLSIFNLVVLVVFVYCGVGDVLSMLNMFEFIGSEKLKVLLLNYVVYIKCLNVQNC